MRLLSKALFSAAVLAMTAGTASAAVVCNDEGDCWRVRGRPTYGPAYNCASTVTIGRASLA